MKVINLLGAYRYIKEWVLSKLPSLDFLSRVYGSNDRFSRPLIPIALSFAGGIAASHYLLVPTTGFSPLLAGGLVICIFLSLFPSSWKGRMLFIILAFFLTGAFIEPISQSPSELNSLAAQRKRATAEGTILQPPRKTKNVLRLNVNVHRVFLGQESMAVRGKVYVVVYSPCGSFWPGQKIRFPAKFRAFNNFHNPGRYDYETAMESKGFTCAASVSDGRYIVPMGPGKMPFPSGLLEEARGPVREFFREHLGPEDFALMSALILGEKQGLTPELREPFNRSGLGHVLVVSGLHIGLVAAAAFFLFRWLLSRSYNLGLLADTRRLAAIFTCFPVVFYTGLAGFHIPGQRAMIMALAFLGSLILGREREVWSTLALAALVVMALNPHALFTISFHLSFCAVIGILLLSPVIWDKIPLPAKHRQERTFLDIVFTYFLGLAVVSLSAITFLLPFIALYFHRASLVGLPANISVVPILGLWVLPSGLFSVLALPVAPQIAQLLLEVSVWGLHTMVNFIRFWSGLSFSSLWVISPSIVEMGIFYGFLILFVRLRTWPWAKKGILALALVLALDVGYWTYRIRFHPDLRVTFLDVGQGNSALVEFPYGKSMLIDGGGFSSGTFDVGKMVVAPYLWRSKITQIDYLVLSHPQADHMNGLRFIARTFDPQEFWFNGDRVESPAFQELMKILNSEKVQKRLPQDLENIEPIKGVHVKVLHPEPGATLWSPSSESQALNNNSLVLKLTFKGKSFLFPGDIERETEAMLVSRERDLLKSDILLAPHHGSSSSSSMSFLEKVNPRICVISSGEGNYFGFPHQETLRRLKKIGCQAIRIDRKGAVECTVREDGLRVDTFL